MRKIFVCLYVSFFLLLMAIGLPLKAQPVKAEAEIAAIMKELDAAGLSVAVVKHNKIIYTHSFGYKNIETNTLLGEGDLFRIASISKSFTATSIMQLVDAKKLSLSDDISDLVGLQVRNPNFPNRVITLKMMMSHTSSLNDAQGYFNLDVINPDRNASQQNAITAMNRAPVTSIVTSIIICLALF